MNGLLDRDLIYVTGKGGVGKTTVAVSLAIAAARAGRRTIVCELAEQRHMSRLFEGASADAEIQLDENLWAVTLDPDEALQEYLGKQVGGAALKVLVRSDAFRYLVAAAPGVRELITMAKVWEIAQETRWTGASQTYDLVVVDAPASGHGVAMLKTPETIGDIARVGTIRRQAGKVDKLLRDGRRTGYVAVAAPEETPVNETLELQDAIRDAVGVDLSAIVVNGLWPERLKAAEAEALAASGAGGAVAAALASDARAREQRRHLRRLRNGSRAPVVTLPYLFTEGLQMNDYGFLASKLAQRVPRGA